MMKYIPLLNKLRICNIQLAILLSISLFAVSFAKAQSLSNGLMFYASYNSSVKPTLASGSSWTKGSPDPIPGISDQAIRCPANDSITYMAKGNIPQHAGTVAFWVRPTTDLRQVAQSPKKIVSVFSATRVRFVALLRPKHHKFYMMLGATMKHKGFRWSYISLPLTALPAKQWTYVTLVWNEKHHLQAIYLNGKLSKKRETNIFPDMTGLKWKLGGGKGSIPLDFDELAIWNRALPAERISYLAHNPDVMTGVVSSMSAKDKYNSWRIKPELVHIPFDKGIVQPGQPFSFKLPISNVTHSPQKGTITLQLINFWGKPVGSKKTFAIKLKSGQAIRKPLSWTVHNTGIFKVHATAIVSGQSVSRDVISFGCLPSGSPPHNSFFGVHVNSAKGLPEMARRLGFDSIRNHNLTEFTWWRRFEPEPGKWVVNNNYKRYSKLGFHFLGTWFTVPYWAKTLPNGQHPPKRESSYPQRWLPTTNIEALRQYIKKTLTTFKSINEWEIWNEPWVSITSVPPQAYVKLCKTIYTEAKKVRPGAQVYVQTIPKQRGGPWITAALKAGLLKYCDGVTFHWYTSPDDPPREGETIVKQLRQTLAPYTNRKLPIIESEGGVTSTTFLRGLEFTQLPPPDKRPPMDFRQAAARMVQSRASLMAAGVKQCYYYFLQPYHNNMAQTYNFYTLLEVTGSPRPTAIAHAILAWQLDGGQFAGKKQLADGLWAYTFTRKDGKSVAILWAERGSRYQVSIDGKVVNMMGVEIANHKGTINIGQWPCYLLYKGSAASLLTALGHAPMRVIDKPHAISLSSQQEGNWHPPAHFSLTTKLSTKKFHTVNLAKVANMALADKIAGDGRGGWMDEGPFNDGRMLPQGKVKWLGVPFEIAGRLKTDKAVVTLRGKTLQQGPKTVGPIEINRAIQGLFIANGANWAGKGNIGSIAATFEVHYADGTITSVPVVIGRQVYNWWWPPLKQEVDRAVRYKAAQPIDPRQPYRYIRVWYWKNPHPDKTVQSVTLKAGSNTVTYVLVGLTAVLR